MATKQTPDTADEGFIPIMRKVDPKTVLTFVTSMIAVFMMAWTISTGRVNRVEVMVGHNTEDIITFREIQVMVVTTLEDMSEDIAEIKADVKAHANQEH